MSARANADDGLAEVASLARLHVREGVTRSEGLIREIAGQGPDMTLGRGFALVRDSAGKPITRAAQTTGISDIEIEFSDGRVSATTGKKF